MVFFTGEYSLNNQHQEHDFDFKFYQKHNSHTPTETVLPNRISDFTKCSNIFERSNFLKFGEHYSTLLLVYSYRNRLFILNDCNWSLPTVLKM